MLLLVPKLVSIGALGGTGLQLFWIVIVAAIVASVALVLYQTLPALRAPREKVAEEFSKTPLYWVYANAAVWEEVITRIVWIGVPMAVLGLLCKKKDALKYLVGGFGMSRAALVLIVISSVIFGFGHLSGWGLWKVIPTLISGLAMGCPDGVCGR